MRSRTIQLIAVTFFAGAGLLLAQTATPPAAHEHPTRPAQDESTSGEPAAGGSMMDHCKAMMAKRQAAMDEMQKMNAELDVLVSKMNAARGDDKVEATAAVLTELVAQRRAMMSMMDSMHPMMMEHMARHMESGMAASLSQSMSGCPMMGGAKKPAEGEHEGHH